MPDKLTDKLSVTKDTVLMTSNFMNRNSYISSMHKLYEMNVRTMYCLPYRLEYPVSAAKRPQIKLYTSECSCLKSHEDISTSNHSYFRSKKTSLSFAGYSSQPDIFQTLMFILKFSLASTTNTKSCQ
jgi:GTP-dependent phosphoenolpyruvate carboxykinase